jgi:hypothetical protein
MSRLFWTRNIEVGNGAAGPPTVIPVAVSGGRRPAPLSQPPAPLSQPSDHHCLHRLERPPLHTALSGWRSVRWPACLWIQPCMGPRPHATPVAEADGGRGGAPLTCARKDAVLGGRGLWLHARPSIHRLCLKQLPGCPAVARGDRALVRGGALRRGGRAAAGAGAMATAAAAGVPRCVRFAYLRTQRRDIGWPWAVVACTATH